MAEIRTIPLFKSQVINAGSSADSDIIDLRDRAPQGMFSLSRYVAPGTSGTAGTVKFSYLGASYADGTFVTPSAAVDISTSGTAGTANRNIVAFNPELMPFMKIRATATGTSGNASVVTAELHIQ